MRTWLIVILSFVMTASQAQQFKISFDKDSMLIGDHLNLDMEVSSLKAGQAVYFPELIDSIISFDLIETYPVDTIDEGSGLRLRVLMTQFDAGIYEVSSMPLLLEQSNGSLDTLYSNTLQLVVNTIEVDTTQAFKPIKEVKSLPFDWKNFFKKLALILFIIMIILAIIAAIILRKKNIQLFKEKPKTMLDYYKEALKDLDELERKKLWQNDQVKEYYLSLSEILRTYIEGRFGVPAMESTTDEIKEVLFLNSSLKDKACEVLAQADLAKFAKFKPLGDENTKMMKLAKDFVTHTKPKEEVTEDA